MPVLIFIDGYNLLGVRGQIGPGATFDGEPMREALLQELMLYAERKGHPITVVFDAWRERGRPEHGEHHSGVHVLYTRGGERADQVIQRQARRYGRDCVVVSSDLEIQHTAKAHGALVLSSQEFQAKLLVAVRGSPVGPTNRPRAHQVSSEKEEDEVTRRPGPKKGNPRKLPKAQRKRRQQLKGF